MTEHTGYTVQPLRPWFSMWLKPRQTVRVALAVYPFRLVILLVVLGCFAGWLHSVSLYAMESTLSVNDLLHMLILLFWEITGLYLLLWLLVKTNQWFGLKGDAGFNAVQLAIAFSGIPVIWGGLLSLSIVAWAFYATATDYRVNFVEQPDLLLLFGVFALLNLLFVLWSIVLFVITLAEVNQYAVWKALVNLLLALVSFVMLVMLLDWVLAVAGL